MQQDFSPRKKTQNERITGMKDVVIRFGAIIEAWYQMEVESYCTVGCSKRGQM